MGVIFLGIIGAVAYIHYLQQESQISRPTRGIISQTFIDPNYARRSPSVQPVSAERLQQGVARLNNKAWQRSKAAQNGEVPSELL